MGHILLLTRISLLSLSSLTAGAFERPLFRRKRHLKVNPERQRGVTLGDLDAIEQSSNDTYCPSFNNFIEPNWGNHSPQPSSQQQDDNSLEEHVNSNESRRSLRRINLDLSGRIMCHVFSPEAMPSNVAAIKETTTPLFHLPYRWRANTQTRSFSRFIPRIYIGANYDLDEIWYGATRWIAKCSWGPAVPNGETALNDFSITKDVVRRARSLTAIMMPMKSFTSSKWLLDLEGEQRVFDPDDTTVRVGIIRTSNDIPSSKEISHKSFTGAPQKLTLEYDSAKYYTDHGAIADHVRRKLQFSPLMKVNLQTPFLHPRFEFHSKHTWIINDGGDRKGGYYGGEYYGSASPASRRSQQIKAMFREAVPQSNPTPITVREGDSKTPSSSIRKVCGRISSWLENDGWMPQKVTTDLLGNLVSINDIGFGDPQSETSNEFELRDSERGRTLFKNLPPRNNMGLRLRISKKIDWSKLGIFPWSNNNYESVLQEQRRDDKQAMRVRVELCGLNESEDRRAWITIDADPFDAVKTFKVVVGQESASLV
ncbi:hypothetical protein HJC23_006686 [Cyclotella cryptica]|uniref:Uncharacterized protein n=1 Tax=Cyclotella cryptica TaxID=29204 RepID=A0ABD3QY24_9STRA|eukprot:CCRYP_001123-RA/>CCRYP_001123-RA protein AED:0.06 eAED:0.06 QI:0/-1/0/1/-1/1/1/0/538